MKNYYFEKANKNLFAVYQTIYSQADIEMWYDWNARLNDTKWSEDCYFLYCDGEKVGGAIIATNVIMFPFLIAPFCDRRLFWKLLLLQGEAMSSEGEIQLKGILTENIDILMSFGAEIWRPRQIMCRPTDKLSYSLDDCYFLETPKESDIPEMARALRNSFLGGIVYEVFGEESIEEINKTIKNCFEWYTATNTLNQVVVAKEKSTGRIIGGCIAGVYPEIVNNFSGINDVFVLPEYRGIGLAQAMIKHSITAAYSITPVIKLHILIGNPAEHLYQRLGFVAGPRFTDMKYKKSDSYT
jgi:GNAT superfamily N-acetyltransferase